MVFMIKKFIIFVKRKKKSSLLKEKFDHFSLGYTIWQFYKYEISESWAYVLNYI